MKDEILTEYAIKGVVAVLIFVAVYVFHSLFCILLFKRFRKRGSTKY